MKCVGLVVVIFIKYFVAIAAFVFHYSLIMHMSGLCEDYKSIGSYITSALLLHGIVSTTVNWEPDNFKCVSFVQGTSKYLQRKHVNP